MAINRGLGKGLSALFSDTDAEYEYSSSQHGITTDNAQNISGGAVLVPIEKIYANPLQPRKNFDGDALSELARSIKEHGILQPLIVCEKKGGYMIVAGERRFRAAALAQLGSLPVIIKDYTDREIKEISLIENLQREDLNPVEAAAALKALMDEYNLTQEDISRRIGKSRPAIANLIRLLTLPPEILDMVRRKKISEGHARCLIGLDAQVAAEIAEKAAELGLSVRETERAVKTANEQGKNIKNSPLPQKTQNRELKYLVDDMQRVFGTKVSAVGNENKGRIFIDYFSPDDIDRIYNIVERMKR